MWIGSGNQNVGRLALQPIANPRRRIVRLKVTRGAERCQSVAGTPEFFGGLSGPQLAAMPHDGRLDAARGRSGRQFDDCLAPGNRQRPAKIDFRTNGVAVVNEIEVHAGS